MQSQFEDLEFQVRLLTPTDFQVARGFDWKRRQQIAKSSLSNAREIFTELIQSTFFKSDEIQVWRERVNEQDKKIREIESSRQVATKGAILKLREWHDKKSIPEKEDWYGMIDESVSGIEANMSGEWREGLIDAAHALEKEVEAAIAKAAGEETSSPSLGPGAGAKGKKPKAKAKSRAAAPSPGRKVRFEAFEQRAQELLDFFDTEDGPVELVQEADDVFQLVREKLVRLGQPFKVRVVQRTILIPVPHSEGGVVV